MKTFLKKLMVVVAAVGFAVAPSLAVGQATSIFGSPNLASATPVQGLTVAADTAPALVIRYNGTSANPQIAVEANGDLTFTVGGSAYTGFECPVSGALGGVIDVSDTACDTIGEVVDIINADQSDKSGFLAVVAAALRADVIDNIFLADAADADVSSLNGEVVYFTSADTDDSEIVLASQWITQAQYGRDAFGFTSLPASQMPSAERVFLPKNPNAGFDTVLLQADARITNAGTIGNFDALCVVENYAASGGSETATVMYREAGPATTALGSISEFVNAGGLRCRDGKIVVRLYASGADTSVFFLQGYGYRFRR
jgi:hypothetical protein